MADVNNSLRAWNRRVPRRPEQLARGNYAQNVIRAPLVDSITDGAAALLITAVPTDRIAIVLFTQDVPVWLTAETNVAAGGYLDAVEQAGYTFRCPIGLVTRFEITGPALTDIVVVGGVDGSVGTTVEEGEMAICEVNSLRTLGYLARLVPANGGLFTGSEGDVPVGGELWVTCVTESGVCAGVPPVADVDANNVVTDVLIPVIVPTSIYTPDVREAGNVIVSGDATFVVVGVYELSTPAP
jgi:hypothetical protein